MTIRLVLLSSAMGGPGGGTALGTAATASTGTATGRGAQPEGPEAPGDSKVLRICKGGGRGGGWGSKGWQHLRRRGGVWGGQGWGRGGDREGDGGMAMGMWEKEGEVKTGMGMWDRDGDGGTRRGIWGETRKGM